MTILKYLKDRRLLLIGWLFFSVLNLFLFLWLAPNVRLDWTVVGYIFLLQSVFYRYFFNN